MKDIGGPALWPAASRIALALKAGYDACYSTYSTIRTRSSRLCSTVLPAVSST
jgi:hypothetical protein